MPPMMDRITVRVPPNLIAALDEIVERGIYTTRSEAVRDALRMLLERNGVRVREERPYRKEWFYLRKLR